MVCLAAALRILAEAALASRQLHLASKIVRHVCDVKRRHKGGRAFQETPIWPWVSHFLLENSRKSFAMEEFTHQAAREPRQVYHDS